MESKTYTAQEMRDAAEYMSSSIRDIRDGEDCHWPRGSDTPKDWEAMLRQAAEMLERCEEIKSRYCLAKNKFDKSMAPHLDSTYSEIVSKISEFNYILHGNTGKEKK